MCCTVLHCVAACCIALQCVLCVGWNWVSWHWVSNTWFHVAVCCSVLQGVALYYTVLQRDAESCNVSCVLGGTEFPGTEFPTHNQTQCHPTQCQPTHKGFQHTRKLSATRHTRQTRETQWQRLLGTVYDYTTPSKYEATRRGGGLGSSTIFKKFNEPYAPSWMVLNDGA